MGAEGAGDGGGTALLAALLSGLDEAGRSGRVVANPVGARSVEQATFRGGGGGGHWRRVGCCGSLGRARRRLLLLLLLVMVVDGKRPRARPGAAR